MKKNDEELKRVRVVRIPHWRMLQMLTPPHESTECVSLQIVELPEGVYVRSVHNDFLTGCFVFIIQHPSFDVVEDGTQPPIHPVNHKVFRLKKSTKKGE